MGYTGAQAFAEGVAEGWTDLGSALHWHLTANHYPAISADLVSVAKEAVELGQEAADDGDPSDIWEQHIDLPLGVTTRDDQTFITVGEAIQAFDLEAFIHWPGL